MSRKPARVVLNAWQGSRVH